MNRIKVANLTLNNNTLITKNMDKSKGKLKDYDFEEDDRENVIMGKEEGVEGKEIPCVSCGIPIKEERADVPIEEAKTLIAEINGGRRTQEILEDGAFGVRVTKKGVCCMSCLNVCERTIETMKELDPEVQFNRKDLRKAIRHMAALDEIIEHNERMGGNGAMPGRSDKEIAEMLKAETKVSNHVRAKLREVCKI